MCRMRDLLSEREHLKRMQHQQYQIQVANNVQKLFWTPCTYCVV